MTIQRMEHVGIVVDDLAAATAFFVELGLKLQGEGPVEGAWVDRVVGLEGVRAEIAMVESPDGQGRLELTKFHARSGRVGNQHAPANTRGIRHVGTNRRRGADQHARPSRRGRRIDHGGVRPGSRNKAVWHSSAGPELKSLRAGLAPNIRDAERRDAGGDAADRHTLRLTMQGAADVVIKAGAEHSVVTLTSHEPSLEDISLRYYEGVSSAL